MKKISVWATKRSFAKAATFFALAWLCVSVPVRANILTNGGFETGTFTPGWSSGGNLITNGLNGSTYAAFVKGGGYQVAQTKSTASIGTPSGFTANLYFAAGLPVTAGANSLEVSFLYQGDQAKGFLRMGVTDLTADGIADVWVIESNSVKTILFSNAVTYSSSGVIHPYRLQFVVNSATGIYDVGLGADGGTTIVSSAVGRNIWVTNPAVTGYTNPTSLEIKLVGGNSGGAPTNQGTGIFDDVDISATPSNVLPVANFTASPTNGVAALLVSFTDMSTGTITNRLWNFGDGGSSAAASPSHAYTGAGSYSVTLTVSGPTGTAALTRTNLIVVTSALILQIGRGAGITWFASNGVAYQAQWTANLTTNAVWSNLGSPIIGSGSSNTVFDPAGANSNRFYQVISKP